MLGICAFFQSGSLLKNFAYVNALMDCSPAQPLLLAHEQTIDRKIAEFKAMGGDFIAGNFSK